MEMGSLSLVATKRIIEETYRKLYLTGTGPPKLYGLPKIHKAGVLLRPIASSRGTFTNEAAKELVKILKHLVWKLPQHAHNTRDFVQQIKGITLHQDECIMSCDVKALSTSVPIIPGIKVIKDQLAQDRELQQKHQCQ